LYIRMSGLDHIKKKCPNKRWPFTSVNIFAFSLVIIRHFFCWKKKSSSCSDKLYHRSRWWWWSIPEGVCFFSLSFSSVYQIYIWNLLWCKNHREKKNRKSFQLNKIVRLLQSFFSYKMTDIKNLVSLSKKEECLYL
jgi:hypothetical protein